MKMLSRAFHIAARQRRCPKIDTFKCATTTIDKKYFTAGQQQQLPKTQLPPGISPPSTLEPEVAIGIATTTSFYIRHGIGNQHLKNLRKDAESNSHSLVHRWQKMMEVFLGTQVHVLSGLGYTPDERGISMYNNQLSMLMHNSEAETQDELRKGARRLWKETLSIAFDIDMEMMESKEVDIVKARDIMHKVSTKMQEPRILEMVAKRIGNISEPDVTKEVSMKHTAVQDILVNEVYLGGDPSLVSECGFGEGEKGYVLFQCALADHQSDPLVSQYIGTAMMRILQIAGLDEALRGAAAANNSS